MDQANYDNEIRKAQLGADYQMFFGTNVGKDILKFLHDEFAEAQNEIVLEQHQRKEKVGTDTLRGQMKILSRMYKHFESRVRDAEVANKRIVESQKTS